MPGRRPAWPARQAGCRRRRDPLATHHSQKSSFQQTQVWLLLTTGIERVQMYNGCLAELSHGGQLGPAQGQWATHRVTELARRRFRGEEPSTVARVVAPHCRSLCVT